MTSSICKTTAILSLVVLLFCLFCTACSDGFKNEMTAEEFEAYRKSYITEYKVCSVTQYIKVRTNGFGGVVGNDLCYAFTYIDGDNILHSKENFRHLEYGLTKVCIGDSNKYVVDRYGETKYYLYLTKDTLQSLATISAE